MIVDVGASAAYVFAICDGLSVLDAATRHPLTPGAAEGAAGAEAGAETGAEAGAAQLPGLVDAITTLTLTLTLTPNPTPSPTPNLTLSRSRRSCARWARST